MSLSVVNLLCIESIASALDPSYNLLDESEMLLCKPCRPRPEALSSTADAHSLLGKESMAMILALTVC
eukprot:766333-Hanusia_phi.AAC.2